MTIPRKMWWVFCLLLVCGKPAAAAPQADREIEDISGKYEFLTPDNTLGVLEEEGKLHGFVEVYQGDDESDAVLSYPITIGVRKKDHVEFKTATIHRKYFRFTGEVARGSGRTETDPDYLRLSGALEIVTVKSDAGDEAVEHRRVVFKSKGKEDQP